MVDRSTWKPQPIFDLIQSKGRIEDPEMESTFNMGVGMFAIVSAEDADRALATLTGRGVDAWQAGEIIEGTGKVQMVGSAHPRLITLALIVRAPDRGLHPSGHRRLA